ncbi:MULTISPECIES: hypothetical protein [Streptacidiphilus]|uniref:WXG100 family type VII secretion target n=1 Tax=Streptacidiphilus cavernicola TaxID=3342716 RepID=A0ABV6UP12_9ACTN|nr:hypothetical protein [Streptacidiphilus jeojiense]
MDASLAAVVGAGVGAIGGLGGGFLSAFGQSRQLRQQHVAERQQWQQEMRRVAYKDLLVAAKQLSNHLWAAADQLNEPATSAADWQASFIEVHGSWTQFSAAAAGANIAGPRAVADATDQFRHSMYEWSMILTTWTQAAARQGTGHLPAFDVRFKTAAEAKRPYDRAFQVAARNALGTER